MSIKLTKQFQKKLELLLESQEYKIRFEKVILNQVIVLLKIKKLL